ncbi:Alpha-(1-_3)-arabinofuranosyltransferase [Nocardioides aquaticus]|uniref:Alpha-(1->3)-arabinofuranosyltransferase n=1 Tax=Nocardioides aquaticus TaxID=160826 RepID=A0ABX8EMA3_9ACTN|nr:DUF3367 domain-containing protein [Nocardioides aquaticus]QVT80746.1 Alpha-(1->3)-arabinofuranosyltransferase [Nocardioides aquaticus]
MTAQLWIRVLAACAVLVGAVMVQAPGLVVSDTKVDLSGNPGAFLGRAAHLWDSQGALGQLQNQAYGYWWPMGPFFWLGDQLTAPDWVVQRLWWGLVLSVALTGAVVLARALGVRTDLACLVTGFAYALSPRMLTVLGPISIEAWPAAVAPWVLLPLVLGSRRGSPRRAAALAALAVGMVGGVNAAATAAVLPLGVIWLLTRSPGPRRRALMLWWPALTALATAWWLVPLFLMGAYSPPFLDFIETGAVTTFPATLFDTLRGTSNWIPYLDPGSVGGNVLISTPAVALNSGILLVVGVAGLAHHRTPHRAFLALGALVGVVLVAAGHTGVVQGWFAPEVQALLDGALSPLRNVHKFDLVLRLPLVLGVGFCLDRLLLRRRDHADDAAEPPPLAFRVNRGVVLASTLLAVVATSLPVLQGRVAPAGAFLATPAYWAEAATWLDENSSDAATLVVPGSAFGEYLWGRPRDEPMQWLAGSRWAVRNVVPLTPPGNIRMLDAVEARLDEGRGSAGLTTYLRRAGIEYLLVRNDLAPSDDVPDPVLVHQALATSPGITRVADFGPVVGGEPELERDGQRVLVNGGWQASYPAVEVFGVGGSDVPSAVSTAAPSVVAGGPEDLLDLVDLGLLGEAPSILATDLGDRRPPGSVVLTDGLRARERAFGRLHDGASAVVTPGDSRRTTSPVPDYLPEAAEGWTTSAQLEGARTVSATSSRSDAGTPGGSDRGTLPFAAVDGSMGSEWVSGSDTAAARWEVGLDGGRTVDEVRVTGGGSAPLNQRVRIVLDDYTSEVLDLGPRESVVVSVPGDQRWTEVVGVVGVTAGQQVALAEVEVDGLTVERTLAVPTLPSAWGPPDAVVLRADLEARRGCAEVGADVRCRLGRDPSSEEPGGLDRRVDLGGAATWDVTLSARPRAGAALEQAVQRGQPGSVLASTSGSEDPRAAPSSTVDGDLGTTWLAAAADIRPVLRLAWLGERTVRGLDLRVARGTAARLPTEVRVVWPGGRTVVELDDGRVRLPGIRTDQLEIHVLEAEPATDLDFAAQASEVPVGVGEVRLRGVPFFPLTFPIDPTTLGCGSGPDLVVDGDRTRTELTASPDALHRGVPVPAVPCARGSRAAEPDGGGLVLADGTHRIGFGGRGATTGATVVLTRRGGTVPGLAVPHPAEAIGSGTDPVGRELVPSSGDDLVALRQNSNAGWSASVGGVDAEPVVVDGWQQGWWVDPGAPGGSAAPMAVRFGPDAAYRGGLLGGAVLSLLLLVVLALPPRRRVTPRPPVDGERALPWWAALPVAVVVPGLVAGWIAAVVAAGAVATLLLLARTRADAEIGAWLPAVPLLGAAAWYAVLPWGSATGWAGAASGPAYLCVPALAALALASSSAADGPVRVPRFRVNLLGRRPRASAGSSTNR